MVKHILRICLRVFLVFVGILVFYFLMAWALGKIRVNKDFANETNGIQIYVRTNGVHCDVLVPVRTGMKDWLHELQPVHLPFVNDQFKYLAFGWGNKGFYLETPGWSDLKVSTAFKALFFMSTSAMHVSWWREAPAEGKDCVSFSISEDRYRELCDFISRGFSRDEKGNVQYISHPGYTPYDCFYEAVGKYSLFKTCNVWTGNALAAAGVRVGWWTPFDWTLMNSLK